MNTKTTTEQIDNANRCIAAAVTDRGALSPEQKVLGVTDGKVTTTFREGAELEDTLYGGFAQIIEVTATALGYEGGVRMIVKVPVVNRTDLHSGELVTTTARFDHELHRSDATSIQLMYALVGVANSIIHNADRVLSFWRSERLVAGFEQSLSTFDPHEEYSVRVQQLEAEGLTTSDAQAAASAEFQVASSEVANAS